MASPEEDTLGPLSHLYWEDDMTLLVPTPKQEDAM